VLVHSLAVGTFVLFNGERIKSLAAMELEFKKIEEQINTVQIAFKKVNTYTPVALFAQFDLKNGFFMYFVQRKDKCLLKTTFLSDAIDKFNSIQDFKENP